MGALCWLARHGLLLKALIPSSAPGELAIPFRSALRSPEVGRILLSLRNLWHGNFAPTQPSQLSGHFLGPIMREHKRRALQTATGSPPTAAAHFRGSPRSASPRSACALLPSRARRLPCGGWWC